MPIRRHMSKSDPTRLAIQDELKRPAWANAALNGDELARVVDDDVLQRVRHPQGDAIFTEEDHPELRRVPGADPEYHRAVVPPSHVHKSAVVGLE
jgi:hypothetical protein